LNDRHKNGEAFWAYATIAPVKNAAGEITHFVATHEDISERKIAEQKLREATERAEVASRTKSELMANMSHELRTPLNASIGFSDTMLHEVFGPMNNARYRDYTLDIHESGKHLLELINDILDVSAIEAGKLELRQSAIELEPVIRTCIKLVQLRADAGAVTLAYHLQPHLPELFGDERRIKQVLLNILSNAVKFTQEGGKVTLSAMSAADGGLRVEIQDNGIGMDEVGIRIALSPFGQVDSKLARKYEGTGLGLPLTKSLVEAHDGVLEIQSHLGSGTTVVVQFPPERSIENANRPTE
jgi:signal transduction histidine kinase